MGTASSVVYTENRTELLGRDPPHVGWAQGVAMTVSTTMDNKYMLGCLYCGLPEQVVVDGQEGMLGGYWERRSGKGGRAGLS